MFTNPLLTKRSLPALGALGLMAALVAPAQAGDQKAVDRAHNFLKTEQRGKDVLSFLHFGTEYRGHKYLESRTVKDGNGKLIPGHFGLIYRFDWANDGWTKLGFLCDAKGNVYKVQVVDTNAILSQPFTVANLSIQVLGNAILQAFKNDLNADQKAQLQMLINNADSKAMLEWSLKIQQALAP
jgi:hypothetical protein